MRLLLTWNALAEDVDMIREATGAEVVLARDKEEAVRLAPTADVILASLRQKYSKQPKNAVGCRSFLPAQKGCWLPSGETRIW